MRKVQFVPNEIYHIYNRGADKCDIFREENDRWRCLQGLCLFNDEVNSSNLLWQLENAHGGVTLRVLKDFFVAHGKERKPLARIMAYCLMPNHFHLLIEEVRKGGISGFMQKFGGGYSRYFDKKYDRSGHLYEGPFKAVWVKNEDQLKYLLAYINVINPGQLIEPRLKEEGAKDVDAIMKFAEEYPWSTHQEYLGKRNSIIIDKGLLEKMFANPEEYRNFAREILLGKKFDIINDLMLDE